MELMAIGALKIDKPVNRLNPAHGAYKAQSNVPFQILVANISHKPITLQKSMKIATGREPPGYTVELQQKNENLGTTRSK